MQKAWNLNEASCGNFHFDLARLNIKLSRLQFLHSLHSSMMLCSVFHRIVGPGARFSKVKVTFRARNQNIKNSNKKLKNKRVGPICNKPAHFVLSNYNLITLAGNRNS